MRILRLCVVVGLLGAAPFPAASGDQVAPGGAVAAPPLPFRLIDWPAQAVSAAGFPAPWNLIQVSGVAVTPRGTVLVLHRGAHPILEFDAGGKFLRSWTAPTFSEGKVAGIAKDFWALDRSRYSAVYGPAGCESCGAHAVRVDPNGHVWVVDATGHVIYKLDQAGKEILRLGTRGVSGSSATTFNLPTDVGFAPNGDVYVSDGYGGARVVKYSREGTFLLEWGKRGDGPGEFRLPHNLVVDGQGRVYVSDRDNQRIQVFDRDGKFLVEWKNTGGVSGLAITPDGQIWTGAVLRDLEGTALGQLPDATGPHGIAVAPSGDVYFAQLSGIAQKFVK